jgi:4-amino-4-deoxy-L-arabinose transferase-like glycosyltransferase
MAPSARWASRRTALSQPACWRCLAVALVANAAIALAPQMGIRSAAIWILAGALPGVLTARIALRDEKSWLTWIVLAAGLDYAWLVGGMLVLSYLPLPLSRVPVLAAYDLVVVALLALQPDAGATVPRSWPPRGQLVAVGALVLVTVFLRVWNLGYSEFQGDEVKVMQKAAALVIGRDEALFVHKKGPGEILLITPAYAVSRLTTELAARLPFALASIVGALGIYAVGQRARSHRAGWWAFLLIALNGFFVAFARIVQYQSLVLLFGVTGVLCALRFATEARRSDLWLSALLLACGLLAHSDGAFAVVPAAWIILAAYWRQRTPLRAVVGGLAGPVLGAAILLALFYVPFTLHPHFDTAQDYILRRVGTPPYNNLEHFLSIGSVYNASYYLGLLALGLLGVIAARLSQLAGPRLTTRRWLPPAAFAVALVALTVRPDLLAVGESDYLGLILAIPLVLALVAPGRSDAWRGMLCWFAVPFLVFGFGFGDPRTHIYTLFPGAALLLGMELDRLTAWRPRLARGVQALAGVTLLVSLAYLVIVFVSHTPEYRRTYPENRLRFFWVPYGDEMPTVGLFGFPYRAGWKVIGALYDEGVLEGHYATNEKTHVTSWYTRDRHRCESQPRYYFIARNVQDAKYVPMHEVEQDYDLVGRIWIGDEAKMAIYERRPATLAYRDYRVEEFAAAFDARMSGPYYATEFLAMDALEGRQHEVYYRLEEPIEFLGYSLDNATPCPGDAVTLTLYWRAAGPIAESYKVFTHIEDPGVVWAQMDHVPQCGTHHTTEWQDGEVLADTYTLILSPETPPGPHRLVVGMYPHDGSRRLAVFDAAGAHVGTEIHLQDVEVVASGE